MVPKTTLIVTDSFFAEMECCGARWLEVLRSLAHLPWPLLSFTNNLNDLDAHTSGYRQDWKVRKGSGQQCTYCNQMNQCFWLRPNFCHSFPASGDKVSGKNALLQLNLRNYFKNIVSLKPLEVLKSNDNASGLATWGFESAFFLKSLLITDYWNMCLLLL